MINLEVRALGKRYDSRSSDRGVTALRDLNMEIKGGAVTALLGPSGCGKTTLLNILAGLDHQDTGVILAENASFSPELLRFGYLFQTPSLIPWRTVLQNVVLGCEISGDLDETSLERAHRLLNEYGLAKFIYHYPATLSVGMQQRVALVRLVLYSADVLLLDEPFRGLDYCIKRELQKNIMTLVEERSITTVLVTHDIEEAITLADRIYVLSQRPGRVISQHEVTVARADRFKMNIWSGRDMASISGRLWQDLNAAYATEDAEPA